jgi:hypothetical protein
MWRYVTHRAHRTTPVLFVHALLHSDLHNNLILVVDAIHLVERVGAGSPVCEEQAETDGLENSSKSTDSDGINRALLSDGL